MADGSDDGVEAVPDSGMTPPAAGRRRYSRRFTTVLGVALVLFCLLVPFLLAAVTYVVEAQEIKSYVTVKAANDAQNPASQPFSGSIIDDHFYFISGCVGNPGACDQGGPGNWNEYYTETAKLYATWPKDSAAGAVPFEQWAAGHVVFLGAFTAETGVFELKSALEKDTTARSIHVVGTSAGGATILSYLSKAMRGELALDHRIRDAMTVDAPLGYQPPLTMPDLWFGVEAGVMRDDMWPAFGLWAKERNIAVFLIDTPNDIVGHEPIPDVPEDSNPVYPGSDSPALPGADSGCDNLLCGVAASINDILLRSAWHVYTGGHVSNSAVKFMQEQWK